MRRFKAEQSHPKLCLDMFLLSIKSFLARFHHQLEHCKVNSRGGKFCPSLFRDDFFLLLRTFSFVLRSSAKFDS
jgi:hypothetical protein